MSSTLIESAKVLVNEQLTPANILLEDNEIKRISKIKPSTIPDMTIHAKGLIALPGLIDAHVHLRDMELSYKETFETGTQAATAGGFTTVLDMPNTRPPTINATRLKEKTAKAQGRLYSNVAFQGALSTDPTEVRGMKEEGAIAFKLYLNKSLQTFDSSDLSTLTAAFRAAKENNALVTVHAEDADSILRIQQESVNAGKTSVEDFLQAHSPEVESISVRTIVGLSKQTGATVHFCHITLPESVRLIRTIPNASCEATAHHLLLNHQAFRKLGTLAICVPPIRIEAIRSGLWKEFVSGGVDILASDHAPHTVEEKSRTNAWQAASGVPGLETSLPLMLTQVSKGKLSLRRLVEATSEFPAKIFRLGRKGALKEGFDADIVLVDPKARAKIDPAKFLSKARYTPFKGMKCVGMAAYTFVNGILVAEKGKIIGPPVGRVIKSGSE
jgi:dihydroorotase (multifunctional complex type)